MMDDALRLIVEMNEAFWSGFKRDLEDVTPEEVDYLGFHMAGHLARHWGQVRTIRNLYRTTHGQPGRFFPDNPTFPR